MEYLTVAEAAQCREVAEKNGQTGAIAGRLSVYHQRIALPKVFLFALPHMISS